MKALILVFALGLAFECAATTEQDCIRRVIGDMSSTQSSSRLPPTKFLEQQIARLLVRLDRRDERIKPEAHAVQIRALRNAWLKALYETRTIEASDVTAWLSDKLLMYRVLKHYLGPLIDRLHPKSIGLKGFLEQFKLVDARGNLTATREQIAQVFRREFPDGFIIKPATGFASGGKTFYKDPDEIFDLLVKKESPLYSAAEFLQPARSEVLDTVTSGERFMVQAVVGQTPILYSDKILAWGDFNEFRVHTLYGRVVPGATLSTWSVSLDKEKTKRVEAFVQETLDRLPRLLVSGMGFGFDVFVTTSGEMRVIEINTNRGLPGAWSGFTHQPDILGAHIRFMEEQWGWKFLGPEGDLLRRDLGNWERFRKEEEALSCQHSMPSDVDVAACAGLRVEDVQRVNEAAATRAEPTIVRIIWSDLGVDEDPMDDPLTQYYLQFPYRRSVPIFVSSQRIGREPFVVPGESVVYHPLTILENSIRGKYNPALVNGYLAMVLSNKYVEARFWRKYAPGAMPKTELLAEFVEAGLTPVTLQERLNQRYPEGWVLKGAYDLATQNTFMISDQVDLAAQVKLYKKSDFLKLLQKTTAANLADPDAFTRALRDHPGYVGWRINRLLKEPDQAIVQSRLRIKKEFRVEVPAAGRVLSQGSTKERYEYAHRDNPIPVSPEEIAGAEKFAQDVVDRLPPDVRGFPLGMDVALLEDGTYKMVESNPQGNSGFLAKSKESIKALDKFLLTYPALVREGKAPLGMSPEKQIEFIRAFLSEIGLDPETAFPHLRFESNRIVDKDREAQNSIQE